MNLDMKKDRKIERQFKKVLEKNELIALNTIENIGLDFLNKDGQKLETENQLKTRYQTKRALDNGTNIDYFIIEKANIDKVDRLDL